MFWGSSYEHEYYYNGTRHIRNPQACALDTPYNKYKIRPTEPVLTDYGKTKEIDAYIERLTAYKKTNPDHIIFRNHNLNKDIKVEVAKI